MEYYSLLIPIAYLGILIGSMATFSHLYRQRQVTSKLRLAPYFGPHTTRNIYLSLLHLQDQPGDSSGAAASTTKVPDGVLRAALLARAVEDIQRIMEVRTRKPALAQLLQRGVVGDEIFQRLQRAEQELELELKDVVAEANALAPDWGRTIFQSANEMVQNKILRDKLDAIKATLPAEKAAWDAQREKSRRELEGDAVDKATHDAAAGVRSIHAQTTTVAGAAGKGPTQQPQPQALSQFQSQMAETAARAAARAAAANSDDDAVIVESPGAEVSGTAATTTTTTTGGGGGGKNKKKKGRR
ncbi:hypothetical protein A1O1_05274 [Capronia coronata CBS 617.96]|uniref:Translocation protein SEC66 n=1 Tax=Capronia coronata CBS 617.96 TaxID=1182541 RepID=W9Z1H5_9EURO|nr:uncharacterized protein A1O1_05274 [Capronia coronata CBS 617.96]EXJ88344.1 hypothetical protein A1O1_05274 [Capronia coronata CBS 617.96]